MKKIFLLLLMLVTISSAAFADEITVLYNGVPMNFSDVSPVIINGRVMLPFRSVFEQMGAEVYYDSLRHIVKATVGQQKIKFSLYEKNIHSEDGTVIYTMDVPPTIRNNRTLVPIRAVSEAAGLKVGWDSGKRTVIIMDSKAAAKTICPHLEEIKKFLGHKDNFYVKNETARIYFKNEEIRFDGKTNSDGVNCNFSMKITAMDKESTFDMIVTGESLYFKTNFLQNCPQFFPKTLNENIPSDKWLRADWSELEEYISGNDNGKLKKMAKDLLEGKNKADGFDRLIDSMFENIDPDSEEEARLLPSKINKAKEIFTGISLKHENGESKLNVSLSAEAMELLTGEKYTSVLYEGTYQNNAETESSLIYDTKGFRLESQTKRNNEAIVEKVLLPDKTINFVDVLYTIRMENNLM